LDSYLIEPIGQQRRFTELTSALKPGLSEWAIHPGIANAEMLAIDPQSPGIRQRDHDYWTSGVARQALEAQDVTLVDYSALQTFWKFQEEK
jgi:hypothetical protein